MTTLLAIEIALLGFLAGIVGGLAGLGGSLIMLPGLAILIGYNTPTKEEQHLFVAAAFVVNVLVSIPAAIRHARNGAVNKQLFWKVFPGQLIGVVLGVAASNFVRGEVLKRSLGVMILVIVTLTLLRDWITRHEQEVPKPPAGAAKLSTTSGVTGLLSGITGLGGGALVIPSLQLVGHVPIKQAIGVSSAMLCFSSAIAAPVKMATLDEHGQSWKEAFLLAALLGPLAMLGAIIGAGLTHKIPAKQLKIVMAILLSLAAARMLLG